jgi:hypothetical protein
MAARARFADWLRLEGANGISPASPVYEAGTGDGQVGPSIGRYQSGFGAMLSKKAFLAGEPNFSAPPGHAAPADVRDHKHKRATTELRTRLTAACRSVGRLV